MACRRGVGEEGVFTSFELRWRKDVVTARMLLHWRCCYVEDVVTLKVFKMLKMLKRLLCWRKGVRISPMVLWAFVWGPWKHWNSISTQFYWFLRKQHKMKNLKNLKLVKTADNIPQVCCPHVEVVESCSMKTTKHCRTQWKWPFQIFLQLHFNCVPENLKPLFYLYIYTYLHTHVYTYTYTYTYVCILYIYMHA